MNEKAERIQELKAHELSDNLTLHEAVQSSTAERHPRILRTQLQPPDDVVENLTYIAKTVFQPIRNAFAFPIRCSSGWRSSGLNRLVGGSPTSQHVIGEALDLSLGSSFLTDPRTATIRSQTRDQVSEHTGLELREDINANFYLFAYACIHLDELDVDQAIHEYGAWFGQPAWVHLSASRRQSRREILGARSYSTPKWERQLKLVRALKYGTEAFSAT